MQTSDRVLRSARMVIACVVLSTLWSHAYASGSTTQLYQAPETSRVGGEYFVEFRARRGLSVFGHLYIVWEQLNVRGEIVAPQVAGFSDGDVNYNGVRMYAARGLVGPLKQDLTYITTASYRRRLTAVQFYQLDAKIRQFRRARPPYHFIFSNCMDFAGEVAESIGLRRPPSLMTPRAYVVWLHTLNGP